MKRRYLVALGLFAAISLCACGQKEEHKEIIEKVAAGAPVIKTAVVDGIEMDYCRFGTGEKIFVVLPGLSVIKVTPNADALSRAFAEFTEDYTVYLFDRRTNCPAAYSIDEMAEDTVAVMKSLGIEKATVFGASQGGMMTQCMAISHPEMMDKIILGSTLCKVKDTTLHVVDAWEQLAREKKGYELNERICKDIYSEGTMKAFGDALLTLGDSVTDEDMDRFLIYAEAIRTFDISDKMDGITCDALVLGCEGDRVTTVEGAKEIIASINCESYIYGPEYGHAVFDEAPDYRPRILEFCKQ